VHHNDSIMHDAMPPQTSFSISLCALSTEYVWFGWWGSWKQVFHHFVLQKKWCKW
jgi:hypothetical protein